MVICGFFFSRLTRLRPSLMLLFAALLVAIPWVSSGSAAQAQADPSSFQLYATFSRPVLDALRSKEVRTVYILVNGHFCGGANVPLTEATEEHEVRLDPRRVAEDCFRNGALAKFVSYEDGRIFDGGAVVGQEPLRMVSTEFEATGSRTSVALPRYVRDTLIPSVQVYAGESLCGEIRLHEYVDSAEDLAEALVLDGDGVPVECSRESTSLRFVIPAREDVPSRTTLLSFSPPVVPGARIVLTGLSFPPPSTGEGLRPSEVEGTTLDSTSWTVTAFFALAIILAVGAIGLSRRERMTKR